MLYSRIVRLALRALPNSTQRLLIAKRKAFLPAAFTQIFSIILIEVMTQQVIHPMVKLQRNVQSLVNSQIIKPTDSIWKIALLYGDEWQHWKRELVDFGFTMQDPVKELLAVEGWDEE